MAVNAMSTLAWPVKGPRNIKRLHGYLCASGTPYAVFGSHNSLSGLGLGPFHNLLIEGQLTTLRDHQRPRHLGRSKNFDQLANPFDLLPPLRS